MAVVEGQPHYPLVAEAEAETNLRLVKMNRASGPMDCLLFCILDLYAHDLNYLNLGPLILRCTLILLFISQNVVAQVGRPQLDNMVNAYHAKTQQHQKSVTYARTDKGVYEVGEDLWFKAVNLDARELTPFLLDSTLYVRLVHKGKDTVVYREKYALLDGAASGHIYIDDSFGPGDYYLETFSKHSYNPEQIERDNLRQITVLDDINKKIEPTADSGKERLSNLTFFPEGGQLVDGITSRVAFKAVDGLGSPVKIKGTLLQNGRPIPFSSSYAGMGSIEIVPKPGDRFTLELDGDSAMSDFDLDFPEVLAEGMVIRSKVLDGNLVIDLKSNTVAQNIYLRCRRGGRYTKWPPHSYGTP